MYIKYKNTYAHTSCMEKRCHFTFASNFAKYQPVFKILLCSRSERRKLPLKLSKIAEKFISHKIFKYDNVANLLPSLTVKELEK